MSGLQNWVEIRAKDLYSLEKAVYLATTGSTNDEALQAARQGQPGPALWVAGSQTAGRGRLERRWESAPGKGLYFSLLLHPRLPAAQAPLIPLAVGLAWKQALADLPLPSLLLKWPNDLWVEGKKLGGVLSEMVSRGNDMAAVVIGVGLNLTQEPADFPPELRSVATSLRPILGREIDAAALLEKILSEIFTEMKKLVAEGPPDLIRRWEEASGMNGRKVRVEQDRESFRGTVLGLAADGQLRVRHEDGETRTILAGDVFLI